MKFKNLIYIVCLTMIGSWAQAQQTHKIWHWIEQLGGSGWDMPNGIVVDSRQNSYVAGAFTEQLTSKKKTISSNGKQDVYVVCFDKDGREQWLWTIGGAGVDKVTALSMDGDDKLYVCGLCEGAVDFGSVQIEEAGRQLFISQLSTKGKLQWVKSIPYTRTASAFILTTDRHGDLCIGGNFTGQLNSPVGELISKGSKNAFVLKMTSDGQQKAIYHLKSDACNQLSSIATDSLGNTYLAGSYTDTLRWNDDILVQHQASPQGNTFITRLDSVMEPGWTQQLRGDGFAEVSALKCDRENNLYISGSYSDVLMVDTIPLYSNGQSDFYAARIDTAGHYKWIRSYGSGYADYSQSISLNNLGGVMISGSFSDTLYMDSLMIHTQDARSNGFIAQLDQQGNVKWAEALGGEGSHSISSTTLDEEGNMFLTGSFTGAINHNGGELKSFGADDVFVAKYYNCPPIDRAIVSDGYLCKGSTTTIAVGRGYSGIRWNGLESKKRELEVQTPGDYYVEMVDKKGCIVRDTITIQELPPFVFSLGNDTAIQIGHSLVLKGPDNVFSYQWQDNSKDQYLEVTSFEEEPMTEQYELTVCDLAGCHWTSAIKVEYYLEPHAADLSDGNELITTFPNPVKDRLHWRFDCMEEVKMTLELHDNNGTLIQREEIKRYIPGTYLQLNMSGLQPGMYHLSLVSGQERISQKIIKQ